LESNARNHTRYPRIRHRRIRPQSGLFCLARNCFWPKNSSAVGSLRWRRSGGAPKLPRKKSS